MLKLIGFVAVIWAGFHFGVIQLLAIWGMAILAMVASI